MKKVNDHRWKITGNYSDIQLHSTNRGEQYCTGVCRTPLGIVAIYYLSGRLTMIFIMDGYEYHRDITGKDYTYTGMAIMAGKFAQEIAQKVNTYKVNKKQKP